MSETGSTALHRAASNGHEASVRLLIQAGAGVAAQDRRGETPLPLAACGGEEKVSKLLLDHRARVGNTTLDGHTALHEACQCDHASVVHLLLEWGVDVAVRKSGERVLHLAVGTYESNETVGLLLAKGADAESISKNNQSMLYGAARFPNPTAVHVLVEHSARTALHRKGWDCRNAARPY